MKNFQNKILCGFQRSHPKQHAFFRLLQKWQAELHSASFVGTTLRNLSKANDCLSYDLLIPKLGEDKLDIGSLNFLLDYLSLRRHITKVGSSYRKWSEICEGILQGSILRMLLFENIHQKYFFLVEK